jgi:ribosomal protein S18 acetylase RimI-like enzyme
MPVAVVYNSGMESANRWSHLTVDNENEVRVAKHTDAEAITRLLRNAPYSHVHADWHYPGDWLGHRSFVVLPEFETVEHGKGITSRFFSSKSPLLACLAVTADPKPAAWVRLAAVANKANGPEMMAAMFAAVADPLRQENITQIAWLLVEDWPETWLPDLGFEHVNEVITFSKLGTDIPRFTKPLNLDIKPVQAADLAALAKIEARAFDPLWRHSEMGLALAKQQTLSFDVAWIEDQPVAFQFSSSTLIGAHLSRITVDPSAQQSGVGSALLAHALEGYDRMGISNITLNTQLDNVASQHFYERFGFRETGERFPVWSIELDQVFQQ